MWFEKLLCRVFYFGTRQRSLCRVFFFGSRQRSFFAECFFWLSAKKLLCREPFIGRSAKASLPSAEALPSVFYLALGKAFFAERPKKNARQSLRRSAKKWIPVVLGSMENHSGGVLTPPVLNSSKQISHRISKLSRL
jgi:hypothetical protein